MSNHPSNRLENEHPDIFNKLPIERQRLLTDWIMNNLFPRKTYNERHTSYGLKHRIRFNNGENEYFTNGEFKGAMIHCGFKVKDQRELNWVFNISQKSPALKVPPHG